MPCGKESSPRITRRKLFTEDPSCEAEDMTAPTTSATPKIALDQRASSRHDKATTVSNNLRKRSLSRKRPRRFFEKVE